MLYPNQNLNWQDIIKTKINIIFFYFSNFLAAYFIYKHILQMTFIRILYVFRFKPYCFNEALETGFRDQGRWNTFKVKRQL